MRQTNFDSDSQRHARPLKFARTLVLDRPLELEHGGSLPAVNIVYETYGTLSPAADNAVLVCHALSGDSHVARHDADDDAGWWDVIVGPGRPIDTDRYFVICPNILGGCRGTTGPHSTDPATGKPYGRDFPLITVGDMVRVQQRLVAELRVKQLLAVVGGSLGGHQVLDWAVRFPEQVRGAAALATSPRLTSQALAYDVIGRNAILRDPNYHGGQYYSAKTKPAVGLAIARMLGHLTYLSREAMTLKFDRDRLAPRDVHSDFETKFSVGSYLAHQGDKFVERFDANSYLTLSMAMDLFDLGGTPPELAKTLDKSLCDWLVISFSSDLLFPPFQSQEIVRALVAMHKTVSFCNITSLCGHDAFLLEDDLDRYGQLIRAFLANLQARPRGEAPAPPLGNVSAPIGGMASSSSPCFPSAAGQPLASGPTGGGAGGSSDEPAGHSPTSIFHARRIDYDSILELIPPGASVLDLGCGAGGLLERLKRRGHRVVGVELDEQAIVACVTHDLEVIHADLNQGLAPFSDGQFDVVVLSQTLQAVADVDAVIRHMLRVGKSCVVSFPNLAYRKLRKILGEEGRAPRASALQGYRWYDTPNIRFLSIADFEDYCRERKITIHRQVALDTEAGGRVSENPNLNADVAIFVISK